MLEDSSRNMSNIVLINWLYRSDCYRCMRIWVATLLRWYRRFKNELIEFMRWKLRPVLTRDTLMRFTDTLRECDLIVNRVALWLRTKRFTRYANHAWRHTLIYRHGSQLREGTEWCSDKLSWRRMGLAASRLLHPTWKQCLRIRHEMYRISYKAVGATDRISAGVWAPGRV